MIGYTFYQIVFMFFIYAFLGWCSEVAYAAIRTGKFVNRGFLNGPICPIYGFGLVAVILLLSPIEDNLILLFLASILITSLLEFLTGWVLEKIFHMKWWDYSEKKFNVGGYICLEFSLIWGFSAVFILEIVHPLIFKFISTFPHGIGVFLMYLSFIGTMADLISTVAAINKLQKRLRLISSLASDMREFSDRLGDAISDTVIYTYGAAVETRGMYSELRDMMAEHKAEEKALADKNRAQEQELLNAIRAVGKERRDRYDAAKKQKTETAGTISPTLNRIMKAFPNMQVYGYERALEELKEYSETLDEEKHD